MENKLLNAGIRITRDCTMKCPYCNIQAEKKGNLSLDEWKKVGSVLTKLGITDLVILGGEPTEYKELPELVDFYEHELDIRCSMTTNAFKNYDDIVKVIKSGLSKLGVSIDNLVVKESISPLKVKCGLDLIDNLSRDGISVNMVDYLVLNKKNVNQVEDIIKYMTERNVSVYILPFHHSDEGEFEHRKNDMPYAFITKEDLKMFDEAVDKIVKMKKNGYLVSNSYEFFELSKKHIKKLDWKCNDLSELRIDSNGKLVCCCDKIGEVNNKYTIFDLADDKKYEEFLIDRKKDADACKGCLWPSSVEAEVRRKN